MACPSVVNEVGASVDGGLSDFCAPGVDADVQVRIALANLRDGRHDALDFLGNSYFCTDAGLDAADVDNARACRNNFVDASKRSLLRSRRATVIEGIRGAIDDGHHRRHRGVLIKTPHSVLPFAEATDSAELFANVRGLLTLFHQLFVRGLDVLDSFFN